jgi:HSP90 family molecular chaperone
MTREEAIDNLGTIARSGSQAFVEQMNSSGKEAQESVSDSIIGQFGVGFYSSFVVSDHVEVLTKKANEPAVRWLSDGTGSYEVADALDLDFDRGTKIVLKLLPESREFS